MTSCTRVLLHSSINISYGGSRNHAMNGGMSLDVASDPFMCFDVAKPYIKQIILDLQRKQQKGIVYSVAY